MVKLRLDGILLRAGYAVSAGLAASSYVIGFGLTTTVGVLAVSILLTRSAIYVYFERYLAFKSFDDFTSGRLRHECAACGASCHLRVNLDKEDVKRLLQYAKETGIEETILETRGNHYWLRRGRSGACVFLKYNGKQPRCSIYNIRPTACRLYPLIPSGSRMKVDPLCPGLSKTKGHTYKEHLSTQEVGSYVRKVLGRI
jgi:Fe-S-cluster containining protein